MPSGLIVRGAMLLQKNGGRWINFPSKEWTKSNGAKGYFPLLEFNSKETKERFQSHVLPLAVEALLGAPETSRRRDLPPKEERYRSHWSGPESGPNDDIGF